MGPAAHATLSQSPRLSLVKGQGPTEKVKERSRSAEAPFVCLRDMLSFLCLNPLLKFLKNLAE